MKRKILRALALSLAFAIFVPSVSSAAWPVAGGGSYVSQRFHDGHRGIDIAGRYGTKVVPAWSGKVVFAGYKDNCGGYQVWIRHANNTYTGYYHLARETTYVGDYVTGSRDQIGTLGTSGCVTGPHVHMEVWKGFPWRAGSYRVNPWNAVMSGMYLPARYR